MKARAHDLHSASSCLDTHIHCMQPYQVCLARQSSRGLPQQTLGGQLHAENLLSDQAGSSHQKCNARHAPGDMHNTTPSAGEWAAGMRSGFGTYWYPGGDIYQGDWRAGRRHGEGSQHCAALEAQCIGDWCRTLLRALPFFF